MNYLAVCRLLGIILGCFSLSMLTVIPFALWYEEYSELGRVMAAMGIGLAFSLLLYLAGYKEKGAELFRREALAVVGLSWLLSGFVGALPLYVGGMFSSVTDAVFESFSGITTTGASVLSNISEQPKCLLLWRSFLHFVGGLGIVVFFVAILPYLGVGGKALFRQEVREPVSQGVTPRIKDTAILLCKVYLLLTVILIILLKLAGKSYFEAINHSFSTIATGGFSTQDESKAGYAAAVQWIIIVFMFLGATGFGLHLRFIQRDFFCYFRSIEFRTFLGVTVAVAVCVATILWWTGHPEVSEPGSFPIRDAFFATLTVYTSTGFGTVDYDQWPAGILVVFVMLMFTGGMAGSTAAGLKTIRVIILLKSAFHLVRTEIAPRRISTVKIDKRVLDPKVQKETFGFFFVYFSLFALASAAVAFLSPGQDLVTSISAVVACLNNIGPGLANVGPTMDYASQQASVKWVLSLLMVMGRLEVYAVLVLFAPRFWFPR